VLLDDELPGLSYLKMLCEQIPELEVVRAFNDTSVFLAELSKLDFDLCILDIEMPGMNGLQIANILKDKPIIFTTAYKEYAAEAFDLNAIDYVRKPIQKERLHQAVKKVISRNGNIKEPAKPFVQINSDKGKALLFFDQLCYAKTSQMDSRDKYIVLTGGTDLVLKNISFEKLLELLPAQNFCRINKKELIALRIVQVFSFDEITTVLKDTYGKNMKLVLSETYRNEFLQKIRI
jgi:DNA-binding LytR/AlgR family response regulator